jgi:hypothetical protein
MHSTHYCPCSGFLFCILTTPNREGILYLRPWSRTWTIVGAMHGECHTLLTLKTMLCISKKMRIGLVYKVFNSIFNDISVISWWSVLGWGPVTVTNTQCVEINVTMTWSHMIDVCSILLYVPQLSQTYMLSGCASTHTTDEHTPRSQVENALSIGGCQDTKQKARTWTIVGAMHGECHTLLTYAHFKRNLL